MEDDVSSSVEEVNDDTPTMVKEMIGDTLSTEGTIVNSNYKEYEEEMDTSDEEVPILVFILTILIFFFLHLVIYYLF